MEAASGDSEAAGALAKLSAAALHSLYNLVCRISKSGEPRGLQGGGEGEKRGCAHDREYPVFRTPSASTITSPTPPPPPSCISRIAVPQLHDDNDNNKHNKLAVLVAFSVFFFSLILLLLLPSPHHNLLSVLLFF